MAQKLNEVGYKALHRPPCSPDLSPTNYHFFKYLDNFLQEKCFHNQQETEKAFQEFIVSRGMDFYATRINNFIFIGKNVLIVMVPVLINKDVFKPSDNDLKFRVWNHYYFCINLLNGLPWWLRQ